MEIWMIVVLAGMGGLLVGGVGMWLVAVRGGGRAKLAEMTQARDDAQAALETYRAQVVDEFGETATRFRALNQSYADLHAQLAKSASLLCGEAAGPLLEAPEAATVPDADDKSVIDAEPTTVSDAANVVADVPAAAAATADSAGDAAAQTDVEVEPETTIGDATDDPDKGDAGLGDIVVTAAVDGDVDVDADADAAASNADSDALTGGVDRTDASADTQAGGSEADARPGAVESAELDDADEVPVLSEVVSDRGVSDEVASDEARKSGT